MITKPTLLLDKAQCVRNIEMMAAKANLHELEFRPHFKTHQSLMVGEWFREAGVEKIAVSSVTMAQYFSAEWRDITIAFPVNILEIDAINELASRIKLQLLVESIETADFLSANTQYEVGIFIKIDVGAGRSGIDPSNISLIDKIMDICEESTHLSFDGFLAHAGHTYACRSYDEINEVHEQARMIMADLRKKYEKEYPSITTSLGDTPSACISENFEGIDELRPGNFVFFDLMQVQITSCQAEQIAVALACPIVAIHEERNEIVVYGGGVHFSKDRMEDERYGTIYGKVVAPKGEAWGEMEEGMYVKRLSQEHGIIALPDHKKGQYKVGDYLMVLPVHSCMTADLLRAYRVIETED